MNSLPTKHEELRGQINKGHDDFVILLQFVQSVQEACASFSSYQTGFDMFGVNKPNILEWHLEVEV